MVSLRLVGGGDAVVVVLAAVVEVRAREGLLESVRL